MSRCGFDHPTETPEVIAQATSQDIPPTPVIRERLGKLVQESAKTRRLLRLAQQRDKLLPSFSEAITDATPANEREAVHA